MTQNEHHRNARAKFAGHGLNILNRHPLEDFLRSHLGDRKSTRLNSSHLVISYAVFCLKKKKAHYRKHPPVAVARLECRRTLIVSSASPEETPAIVPTHASFMPLVEDWSYP